MVPETLPVARPPRTWWLLAVLAAAIAGYAVVVAILEHAPAPLQASLDARPWLFRIHMIGGAVALALAPLQLHAGVRARRPWLHRRAGWVAVAAIVASGLAGAALAPWSAAGTTSALGFGALATAWVTFVAIAVARIRSGDVAGHRAWMIRVVALTLAAVTLRIELPLLIAAHGGDFTPAYAIVSWLCWVPNLIVAEVAFVRRPPPGLVERGA